MEMTETGRQVYLRTYARKGENWEKTVQRVVDGNLNLVGSEHIFDGEREKLLNMMTEGKLVPAGRHLAMSGVPGRQFLANCHVSGWHDDLSEHFTFTFLRLMEGGGVGANYSNRLINPTPYRYRVENLVRVHFICDSDHKDYARMDSYIEDDMRPSWLIPDSREGWAEALRLVIDASTSDNPYGVRFFDQDAQVTTVDLTFDVSRIRPQGSEIRTFGGTAAGPLPLMKLLDQAAQKLNEMWMNGVDGLSCMDLDHLIAQCVISGNVRRSARMSLMHWYDPQIWHFLKCKAEGLSHWSTNISIEVDDEFIELLQSDCSPESESDIARRNHARKVWDAICEGMLLNGEPGFWDSTLSNVGEDPANPVISVNPCGEQALAPWENCTLGHVNLAAFDPGDMEGILAAHKLMARFLIRATFGDITSQLQKEVVHKNRRIGVGHLGYQWWVNRMGIRYSKSHLSPTVRTKLTLMALDVGLEAEVYSDELGIPRPIKTRTVAPTGTIAKLFGVSEGIHPIYGKWFIRRIRFSDIDPSQIAQVESYRRRGYNVVKDIYSENTVVVEIPSVDPILLAEGIDPDIVESANEISVHDMLLVQRMYQELYADNAVSFTVNVPEGYMTPAELGKSLSVHLGALKGTTVMVDGSRPLSPYERISKADYLEMEEFFRSLAEADTFGDGGCRTGACPVK